MSEREGRLLPEELVRRQPPQHLVPEDEWLFSHESERRFPPVEFSRASDAVLLSNGMLVRSGRLSLAEYFAFDPPASAIHRFRARAAGHVLRLRSRSVRVEDELIHFADASSQGFFHWFGDSLQKLEALIRHEPASASLPLFVPLGLPPFVSATLDAYDFPAVHAARHERVRCGTVVILPRVAPTGNFRPVLMQAMRSRLRAAFAPRTGDRRRVYISRSDAPYRRVVNEDEIRPVLDKHGVTFVSMASLSYPEQARLMAGAELLVGLHGAGLTHSLLMVPGSHVLELRASGDAHNNCYFSLASALDHRYSYLLCEPVRRGASIHKGDFVVNPAALDEVLQRS